MIKGPKMKSHFAPSFYLNNMLNDLQRVRSTPQSIGISLPTGAMVAQTYMAATDSGFSTQDKRSWRF
jgi:3-hydroxyisobutyrate dehydrogenase-like beta-hydroxyacid dehydrogenase